MTALLIFLVSKGLEDFGSVLSAENPLFLLDLFDQSRSLLALLNVVRMDCLLVDLLITFEVLGHLDVLSGGLECLILHIVLGLAHAHIVITGHG